MVRHLALLVFALLASSCSSYEKSAAAYLQSHPDEMQKALDNLAAWQKERRSYVDSVNVKQYIDRIFDEYCGSILGNRTAPIEVAVFSDHNCYFCQQALSAIEQSPRYRNGEVAIVVRELPIVAKDSRTQALRALKAAREGKYYATNGAVAEDSPDQAFAASRCGSAELDNNVALAKVLGISGTPAFVVDGAIRRGWNLGTVDFKSFWKL